MKKFFILPHLLLAAALYGQGLPKAPTRTELVDAGGFFAGRTADWLTTEYDLERGGVEKELPNSLVRQQGRLPCLLGGHRGRRGASGVPAGSQLAASA